ncbi:MAG: FAD-dependent oxidoreductase [Clostridium sp.]|nr:FAD-dependent oxidoreductase [Clostridium sp.]
MYEITCDVAIIGAGPAGLSAAVAAKKEGAGRVLLIERDESVGGILQQCIHPGFGLTYFKEELTGPEYAGRFSGEAEKLGAEVLLNSMVLEVIPEEMAVYCVNSKYGMTRVKAGSIVLAMGCREKTRAGIQIPGSRPAGVYTAGAAQRLINRQNAMVGREVVILGSGDIGMIMARRMSLEGAHVKAVVEIMDFLAGLTRNKVQCLDDFGIPLKLSHTVTRIVGNERVEGVYVAAVDENKKPIPETEEFIPCDTLLLSVGLLPENELTRQAGIEMNPVTNGPSVNQYMQTSSPGIFACGNVVHVNDLVDNVTTESMQAGACAARYALRRKGGQGCAENSVSVCSAKAVPGRNVRYLCPQSICLDQSLSGREADEKETVRLFFRVLSPDTEVRISAKCGGEEIKAKKALRINPGEMESIEIPLNLVKGDVTVEIEKEA